MITDIGPGELGEACRGTLLGRERRGMLSDPDRIALDAHLAGCTSCRLSREIGADFDAADVVDVQDGARIRALSETARRWRGAGAEMPGRRRARVAVAAAVLIFGGTASGAVWMWRQPISSPPVAVPAAPIASSAEMPERGRGLAARASAKSAAPAAAFAEPVPPPVAHTRAAAASPTTLLRQASEARRAGDVKRATALYRKLQREFASSPEAVLSTVPLGRLLMQAGAPRAALVQFDRYLTTAPGGTLVPEALYGRARALADLGDVTEERRTWQRLSSEFPGSAYAPSGAVAWPTSSSGAPVVIPTD